MSGSADLVDRYIAASATFGRQVVALTDEQWYQPTPCPEWSALAIVAHVVLGEAQTTAMIAGQSPSVDLEMEIGILGPDPVSSWRGTALAAIEAVRGVDLDLEVEHMSGRVPLAQALGFRITDNLVHAWDLSITRGDELGLEPAMAQWCLDFWLPLADQLGESELFGPMTEPVDDTPGARLLALLGRTPHR